MRANLISRIEAEYFIRILKLNYNLSEVHLQIKHFYRYYLNIFAKNVSGKILLMP